jgi:hypothetical protein
MRGSDAAWARQLFSFGFLSCKYVPCLRDDSVPNEQYAGNNPYWVGLLVSSPEGRKTRVKSLTVSQPAAEISQIAVFTQIGFQSKASKEETTWG